MVKILSGPVTVGPITSLGPGLSVLEERDQKGREGITCAATRDDPARRIGWRKQRKPTIAPSGSEIENAADLRHSASLKTKRARREIGLRAGYWRRRLAASLRLATAARSHARTAESSASPEIATRRSGKSNPVGERFRCPDTATSAVRVDGFFFPQDRQLDLRAETYSPWILERMEWAGANVESFQKGAAAVEKFLNIKITAPGLRRITGKLGQERAAIRDVEVENFLSGELRPEYAQPPTVAAVFLDGGRAQIRASDSPRGVHAPRWMETKVANLCTYTAVRFDGDPQPEPPSQFLDPPKVVKLVQGMKGASGGAPPQKKSASGTVEDEAQKAKSTKAKTDRPQRKVRTVVATTKSCDEFGSMVAAEAQHRGFYEAKKKAFLGDGSPWIWGILGYHFMGFVGILDFVHLISHLYCAAQAAHKTSKARAWTLYEKLVRLAWAGSVAELKRVLRQQAERLGEPPDDALDDDPRKILRRELEYVITNRARMDYAQHRRDGLPIFTAPIESLIKEVNMRVKGTEKFWIREGLEAVLQVRAAHLSQDGRLETFWAKRPHSRAAGSSLFRPQAVA